MVSEGVIFTSNVTNNITVGDGGAAPRIYWYNWQRLAYSSGEDTSIVESNGNSYSMTVNGGGVGACSSAYSDAAMRVGQSGGSGGGSGWLSGGGSYGGGSAQQGTITYSYTSATFYGNRGGNGLEFTTRDSGGGGGAGGTPTQNGYGQNGGDGIQNNYYNGYPIYYGGGGAGGADPGGGNGGLGGGGGRGTNGTDGLGGGGGGDSGTADRGNSVNGYGFEGGSGVVILRFKPIG